MPFDATTKELATLAPADWLEYAGLPRSPVEVIPAGISTVTAAADEVLRVQEAEPWLAHLEFLSGYSRELPRRLLRDNVLLDWRTTCRCARSWCSFARRRMGRR
jgi:hypothetical protein